MAERVLAVIGALLLVLGPLLQAIAEIREYNDLLAFLRERPVTVRAGIPSLGVEASAVAIDTHFLRNLKHALELSRGADSSPVPGIIDVAVPADQALRIRGGLVKARNWLVVLGGSTVLLAVVSLVAWVETH